MKENLVQVVTNAPDAYDYGYVRKRCDNYATNDKSVIRWVEMPKDFASYQMMRYASGNHIAQMKEEFDKSVEAYPGVWEITKDPDLHYYKDFSLQGLQYWDNPDAVEHLRTVIEKWQSHEKCDVEILEGGLKIELSVNGKSPLFEQACKELQEAWNHAEQMEKETLAKDYPLRRDLP